MQYETITMPDAGIGSFLTSNMDEIDDNILMFGNAGGINSMKEVADRMAKMGREGDTFVVHASEKEVMVPREVAENNPQLVAEIKDAIAAEGADPEAYVVGSDRNSINPMTGQREFFLKKLVKGIKKVFKKAAKIIIPVGLNYFFPGMGAIASGTIGAGIGGLIQGESFGDALKSAALGGITAGIASGVSGALGSIGTEQTLGQGFITGFKGAFPSQDVGFFTNRFKIENAPGFLDPLGTGRAMDAGFEPLMPKTAPEPFDLRAEYLKNVDAGIPSTEAMALAQNSQNIANAAAAGSGFSLKNAALYGGIGLAAADAAGLLDPIPAQEVTEVAGLDLTDQTSAANPIASTTSVLDANEGAYRVGSVPRTTYFTPSQITVPSAALYGPSQGNIDNLYANLIPVGAGTNAVTPSEEALSEIQVAQMDDDIPGFDRTITGMRPAPSYGRDALGNIIYNPYFQDPIVPATYAASGGAMNFPRRTGQIEGPGTETSDDIPAMLSDGEFVMTAKAVKGAGNGSREQGFRKMYDIMRSFEGGAVA
tara:strand:- start:362 stop:1975 length:1614 start_codon:yes stop_codon:yes gene_type:complete